MTNNSQINGVLWMILHCFLISSMAALVRIIASSYHILQIVFFYSFVAFLILFIYLILTKQLSSLKTSFINLHLYRSFLGVISLSMYFYAFTIIPLTEARAIALTSPLVSSLFAIILLKEKVGYHRILALIIGFIGAIIILKPGDTNFSYVSLMVIASVIMWAVIDIIIKIMTKKESTTTQMFYLSGLMSLFLLPFNFMVWKTPDLWLDWSILISLGLIFLINITAVFKAYKYADLSTLMPFDFSGMIFTAIIAYICFGEIIMINTLIGSIIIVTSSLYIVKRELLKKTVSKENIISND